MAHLTAERLRELLDYDPETGVFRRRDTSSPNPRVQRGAVAGTRIAHGYIGIRVDYRRYLAHRLAWFYVFGDWPKTDLDHVNGSRDDNRICNLREATRSQNMANAARPKTNTSGHKGVSFCKATGKWLAYVSLNGKMKNLGRFDAIDDAVAVRAVAARKAHGEFWRE